MYELLQMQFIEALDNQSISRCLVRLQQAEYHVSFGNFTFGGLMDNIKINSTPIGEGCKLL